jgi:hypothetical protein
MFPRRGANERARTHRAVEAGINDDVSNACKGIFIRIGLLAAVMPRPLSPWLRLP